MRFLARLTFAVLRASLSAAFIVFAGWLAAVPPSADERRALEFGPGPVSPAAQQELRTLRIARFALSVAPDLAITLITRQGDGRVHRDEVETALNMLAEGKAQGGVQDPVRTLRAISGAKFLSDPTSGG